MVRAPCCDKMGLKKGPWTQEEDHILVSFIHRSGHGNWRALPKQAGLMRCGKSCRLRWMNYLRPDIKRGNFSKEEEETIITLHQLLGNRWSAIAARLPGRTDNEIKNVWHTHLKKRVIRASAAATQLEPSQTARSCGAAAEMEVKPVILQLDPAVAVPASPTTQSSSDFSSAARTETSAMSRETNRTSVQEAECTDSSELFVEMDESFWTDALSSLESSVVTPVGLPPDQPCNDVGEGFFHRNTSSEEEDDLDFWFRVLRASESCRNC